jgi:hypothetical protein
MKRMDSVLIKIQTLQATWTTSMKSRYLYISYSYYYYYYYYWFILISLLVFHLQFFLLMKNLDLWLTHWIRYQRFCIYNLEYQYLYWSLTTNLACLDGRYSINLKRPGQPLLHAKQLFNLHNLLHDRKNEDAGTVLNMLFIWCSILFV